MHPCEISRGNLYRLDFFGKQIKMHLPLSTKNHTQKKREGGMGDKSRTRLGRPIWVAFKMAVCTHPILALSFVSLLHPENRETERYSVVTLE